MAPCCGLLCCVRVAPTQEQKESYSEDWRKAAYYIDDAFHNRGEFGLADSLSLPRYRQRCFGWVWSSKVRYAYFPVIFAHCLLAFFEPTQVTICPGKTHPAVWVIHSLCLVLYIIDLLLHFLFYGFKAVWKLRQNQRLRGQFILVCLFLVDFVILVVQDVIKVRIVAPFRCLRFAMIICKSISCAHIFTVTLLISKRLIKVFMLFIGFIFIFSCIGVHLYSNDYHFIGCPKVNEQGSYCTVRGITGLKCSDEWKTKPNCTGTVSIQTNCNDTWNTKPYTGSFDHVGPAFIRMFGLLTTENYPELMIPPFKRTEVNLIFFASFLYVSNYLLMAILLAIIVNFYWEAAKVTVKADREQRRTTVGKAWNILDPQGQGKIPVYSVELFEVLRNYNPRLSDEEIKEILSYVDFKNDGYIDALEWTVYLCEALSFEYIMDQKEVDPQLPPCRQSVYKFLCSKFYQVSIVVLIVLYGLLFAIKWYKMPETVELAIAIIRAVIILIFLVEFVLTLIVVSTPRFRQGSTIAQLALIVLACLATAVYFSSPKVSAVLIRRDYYTGLANTVAVLAVLARLPLHVSLLRRLSAVFFACVPVMITLIAVLLTVFYFYAVIGLESFYGRRQPTAAEGYSPSHYDYGCGLGFQTFGCSCLAVFQILVTNDWHGIQNAVSRSTKTQLPVIYFVSCFIILNYLMSNLLIAIAIEAYKKLGEKILQEKKENKDAPTQAEVTPAEVLNESDIAETPSRRRSLEAELNDRRAALGYNDEEVFYPPSTESQVNSNGPTSNSNEPIKRISNEEALRQRRRRPAKQKSKVIMAFRKKCECQINLHVDDVIEEIHDRKEYIYGTTSRGRTGWFPAECVSVSRRGGKLAKERLNAETNNHQPVALTASSAGPWRGNMKRKKNDWKEDILGNITVLNEDEALRHGSRLNVDFRALRSAEPTPTIAPVSLVGPEEGAFSSDEGSCTPEPEPQESILLPIVVEEAEPSELEMTINEEANKDTADSLHLLSPYPTRRPRPPRAASPSPGAGGIPEWAQKFLSGGPVALCAENDQEPDAGGDDSTPEWAQRFLSLGTVRLRDSSRAPSFVDLQTAEEAPPAVTEAVGKEHGSHDDAALTLTAVRQGAYGGTHRAVFRLDFDC